ncbi:replication protein A 70 kDa DNA-binding subunit C [Trifolium repens]|nr:replication protein A 70 kDa DNA-binding subunit C [Trifolium repens]
MDVGVTNDVQAIITVNASSTKGVYEVRVLSKWRVTDSSATQTIASVDMVLIDRSGHKIQASIPSSLLSQFDDQIVEGRVYRMSGFTVKHNLGVLVASYHRFIFIFNENTKVDPSDSCFIPSYGFSLIAAENVLLKKFNYGYMVDVVGVVTKVKHDKNFYPDGRVTRSVTFKLNDQKGFWCEVTGDLVDEFHKNVLSATDGLPIIVLQFARICIVQGATMVKGIEGVTKVYVNPHVAEVINFRNGLIEYLSASSNYFGLRRRSNRVPFSHNLDFVKDHPVKTLHELERNPEIGTFIVNARMVDIVHLDPWWYPICECFDLFTKYIGAFHCTMCYAKKSIVAPKVRLTIGVEDQTGYTLFHAFDHVMIDIAAVNTPIKAINSDEFYKAFSQMMGKSIMFIVNKSSHDPHFMQSPFEILRVSNEDSVIKYFTDRGLCKTPSKVVKARPMGALKQVTFCRSIRTTHQTTDLLEEYGYGAYPNMRDDEAGPSNGSKRARV